jgi:hypothetical protein
MKNLLNHNSPTLKKIQSLAMMKQYELPGNSDKDTVVIGTSGGIDSTGLAIIICTLFPERNISLIFTDTGCETPGTLESLDRLESFIDKKIIRLQEENIYSLIKHYNGFLPAQKSRWCTHLTKIVPFENYLDKVHNQDKSTKVISLIGLRIDEPTREGLSSTEDWLQTHFPLRDLEVDREMIFRLVSETIGIPDIYLSRTRSGCVSCYGMRESEVIATLARHPKEFSEAEKFEKLTELDMQRYAIEGDDLSGQFMVYPVPSDLLLFQHMQRKRNEQPVGNSKKKKVVDLFGEHVLLYVGIEWLQDPGIESYGFQKDKSFHSSTGCYFHNLVGWSTSRGGLSRKLNGQFHYRLDTAEVLCDSQDELRSHYRQAVYLLQIPSGLVDIEPPSKTEKVPDGRLVDAGNNSLLSNGKPVFIRNKKVSKADRASSRKQGIHSVINLEVIDALGQPVDAVLTDDGLFCDPIDISQIQAVKHTDKLQRLTSSSGHVLFNGASCYREKKGKVLKTGSFSWRQNQPIAQVRQLVTLVKRTMKIESLRQAEKDYSPFKDECSWEAEQYASTIEQLENINFSYGSIIGMERNIPSESRPIITNSDELPCFACSK